MSHSQSQSNGFHYPPPQTQQQHTKSSQSKQSSNHRHHNHTHTNNKVTRSKRSLKTRVFATGYNYNYQFGVESNENYSSQIIELEWCRGCNISYICSGLTHLIYLSFTGNYYFCGQIDTEKLGLIDGIKADKDLKSVKNNAIITKSSAATMATFINTKESNIQNIKVSRIADGVSARHIIAISRDFKAYSMGSNQRGQLGLSHFKSTLFFDKIEFKLCKQLKDKENYVKFEVIDASAGESHSAFVVMPKCTLPIRQILCYWYRICDIVLETTLENVIYKIIGKYILSSHSLLSSEGARGRLYVCGCNNFGQLGIGNNPSSNSNSNGKESNSDCYNEPMFVVGGGLSTVSIAQVSCGENHTVCLDNRGRVYCFGDNYYGQSGAHLNHYENVYYPLKVEHFKKEYQARIVKVSSGKYHCVALDKLGRVFCWGLGAYGQLGCDKLNKRIVFPILVEALADKKIVDVRSGIYHTIALTNRGKLYCWGSNTYGQCFQSANLQENVITPTLANLDRINGEKLAIYKVFCGYYSTLILARDAS